MTSSLIRSTLNKGEPRVLILGGSGFIGTRLTNVLTERRGAVRIGDLRSSERYPELWQHCDVRDGRSLDPLLAGVESIVNLAAEHRDDVYPVTRYYETNVHGASEVCRAARRSGAQKIVFTSSVAVYGFQSQPVDEGCSFAPFNPYGETKLKAEEIYQEWAAEDAARSLVIVRPTVVFGEGNRGNVYNLMRQIDSGHFLMVGSGKNIKSMAYVGNIAAFLAHALSLGTGVHIFNYVDGPDMNTMDLVRFIKQCLGKSEQTLAIPKPLALAGGHLCDVAARLSRRTFPISAIRVHKFCNTTQFRADRVDRSGFVRPYSLAEGLERTIQFDFPGCGARSGREDQSASLCVRD